jgi:LysM repeat protein
MSSKVLFYLVIATVLLALVTVVILLSVPFRDTPAEQSQPTTAEDTGAVRPVQYEVSVQDRQVILQVEQAQQVRLLPLSPESVVISPVIEVPTEQPTAVPVVEQPLEQPTEVPPADQPPPDPTPIPTVPPPPAVVATGQANFGVDEIIFINYTIVAEDTLYRLTEKYATSIELMARHGISSINFVVGSTIRLPIANPDRCPALRPYIVREKDTVYRIANAYATTPNILRDINRLNEAYRIDVAQVLCVP